MNEADMIKETEICRCGHFWEDHNAQGPCRSNGTGCKCQAYTERPSISDTFTFTRDEMRVIRDLAFIVLKSKQNVGRRILDYAESARKITNSKYGLGTAINDEPVADDDAPYVPPRGTHGNCAMPHCDQPFEDLSARFAFHKRKSKGTPNISGAEGIEFVCGTCSDIRKGYQPPR